MYSYSVRNKTIEIYTHLLKILSLRYINFTLDNLYYRRIF